MSNQIRLNMRNAVREDRSRQLSLTIGQVRDNLYADIRGSEHAVQAWADHPEVARLVPKLVVANLPQAQRQVMVHELSDQLITGMQLLGVNDYRILDRGLVIRAAFDTSEIGQVTVAARFTDLMHAAWQGRVVHTPVVVIDAQQRNVSYFVIAPVPGRDGRPIALLSFKVDALRELDKALGTFRRGVSGESYAFTREGLMLSPSRFESSLHASGRLAPNENAVMRMRLEPPDAPRDQQGQAKLTRAVSDAVVGGEGRDAVGYADYRGVPVIGAWTWLPDLQIGLVTEIDIAEAYGFLMSGRMVLLGFLLLVVGCVVALAVFSHWSLLRVARSERQLQQSNADLEQRVTERTAEFHQASERLSHELLFQRALLDALPTPVFVRDAQARLVMANKAYEQAFGVGHDEARAQVLREEQSFKRTLIEKTQAMVRRVLAGEPVHGQLQYFTVNEGLRDYLAWLSPLRDERQTVTGAICALVDVTERERAQRLLRERNEVMEVTTALQRGILTHAGHALIATDTEGLITLFNPAAEQLLGYSAHEMVGHLTPAVFHDAQEVMVRAGILSRELAMPVKPGFEVFAVKARLEPADENDWTYVCKDGRRVPVRLKVSALRDDEGGITGFLGIAYDLTETRERELALRQATALAESAARAKSEFLATMSHEIRTPMNGVVGMTDLLAQTPLDLEQERMVNTIRGSAAALLTILNDILDFSKIEAGKLSLEAVPVSLRELVDSLTETLGIQAAKKGLRLLVRVAPNTPRGVAADPVRLRQVLTNLLSNAVKFTERGTVRLDIAPLLIENSSRRWIRFSVRDEGIGMTPDQQAQLFQPFEQAESSTTRRFGGTGLGLSIVKQLVEIMQGRIQLQSESGRGTEFTVDLPLPVLAEDPVPDTLHLHGVHVLVYSPDREHGQIVADHAREARADAAVFATATALRQAVNAALAGDGPVVVYLAHSLPEQESAVIVQQLSGLASPERLRFVAGRRFDSESLRLPNVVSMRSDPLTRDATLTALGEACGRASPPVRQPVLMGDDEPIQQTPEQAEAAGRLLLVAEDNFTNQEVIRQQLAMLGYCADIVGDGRQALTALGQRRYGCLLTDCHMPEMDGYELAKRIRSGDVAEAIPIIAITANALQGEADRCRAAGMDYHLAKPLDMRKLRNLLENLLPAAQPSTPMVVDEAAAFDLAELRALIGDDPVGIREILQGFCVPTEASGLLIARLLAEGNAVGAGLEAHKLRSSARAIGARALAECCRRLEQAGKSGHLSMAQETAQMLREELRRTVAAVRDYLEGQHAA